MESSHLSGPSTEPETHGRTTVLLVRHGHTAAVGERLVGRLPGVELTPEGRAQAEALVQLFAPLTLAAIYSSPLERVVATARPLAAARGLEVLRCDDLTEMDFGAWTGYTFDELDRLPAWHRFNESRGGAVAPGGESAAAVQRRAVRAVQKIAARHPGALVAAFSHADVIRSVLLHYTGRPLDHIHELDIAPASTSAIAFTSSSARATRARGRGTVPLEGQSR